MAVRNVKKNLAGVEDLLLGKGEVSQTRGGAVTTVSRLDVPLAIDTAAEMSALDITKYTRARVYSGTTAYNDYVYDASSLLGIASDTGPGTWLLANQTINDLSQAYEFDTLADVASSSIVFPLGKKINLKETSTGLLDGGLYEVTTVSPLAITELKQGKLVGDGGKKYIVIAGVLRHNGANWGLLLDGGHTSINTASVSVEGSVDLTINYTKAGSKVVSLLCGPDEGYARLGMICGASVGTSLASIRASLPMSYQIETNGKNAPTITAPSEIINRLTPTRSGFKLRVNHTGAINANPMIIPIEGSIGGYATNVTSTAFNIQQFSNSKYTYKVRYATTWQLATNDPNATLDTTSFASSGNIVVNTSTVDNTDLISVTSRYAQVGAISKNTTSFTLRFYDFAGTLLQTEANGTMEAYIGYGEERIIANTSTTLPVGKYNVENGRVLVYWDDLTSITSLGDNANIWFKGVVLE